MIDKIENKKPTGINPQVKLPEEERIYCEKCKILLADIVRSGLAGNKQYLCDRCM